MDWEGMTKALGSRAGTPLPPPCSHPGPDLRTHLVPRQPRAGDQQLLRVPGALPPAQVEEHHGRLQLSQRPAHLRLENQLEPQLRLCSPLHWNGGDTAVNPPRRRGTPEG